MSCLFCTNDSIRARTVFANELVYAFLTNIPIVPGHTLVCPKRCVSNIAELTNQEFLEMRDMVLKLQETFKETFEAEGFNVAWNQGKIAGQSVSHVHIHVLPRKTGDTGITGYDPRKFLYRTGSREKTPEDELLVIAQLLKDKLSAQ